MANGQVVLVITEPLGGGAAVRSVYFVAERDPARAEAIIAAIWPRMRALKRWDSFPKLLSKRSD